MDEMKERERGLKEDEGQEEKKRESAIRVGERERERNRGRQIATGRLRSPAEKVRFGNVTAVIVPD